MAQKIMRRKKKWFMIIAPEVFKNKELSEIPAFEPNELVNRFVEINLMQITGVPRDQQKRATLKITEVKGEKAYTIPLKFFLINSYVQRSSRRFKERFISVLNVKAKDGKTIKIKFNILAEKKLPQKLRAEILREIKSGAESRIAAIDSTNIFTPMTIDKLAIEIRKEVRKLYPISKLQVWKLSVIE